LCLGGASDIIVSLTDITGPLKMLEISGGLPLAYIHIYIYIYIYIWLHIYITRFFLIAFRWCLWRHRLPDRHCGPVENARNIRRPPLGLYTYIYIYEYTYIQHVSSWLRLGGASDVIVSLTDVAGPLKMLEISGGLPLAYIHIYIWIHIYITRFSLIACRWCLRRDRLPDRHRGPVEDARNLRRPPLGLYTNIYIYMNIHIYNTFLLDYV